MRKVAIIRPNKFIKSRAGNNLINNLNSLSKKNTYSFLRKNFFSVLLDNKKTVLFYEDKEINRKSYDFIHFSIGSAKTNAFYSALNEIFNKIGINNRSDIVKRTDSTNKLMQNVLFHVNGIQIPKTFYFEKVNFKKIKPIIQSNFSFPFVVKALNQQEGNSNFLVYSMKDLQEKLNKIEEPGVLVQEFIENSSDFRLMVFNDRVGVIKERVRNVDNLEKEFKHLNNSSKGAETINIPVESADPELLKLAYDSLKVLNRSFGGVDIVKNSRNNQYYILEINSSPAISNNTKEFQDVLKFDEYISELIKKTN